MYYPMMVSGSDAETGMFITDYVADEDVTDPFHSVTVKAPSLQAVKVGIAWVDVAEEEAEIECDITDNGDGTYTLTPKEGLVMGRTYQLLPTEVQELYGTTNSTVTPAPMEYTGFEPPAARSIKIEADEQPITTLNKPIGSVVVPLTKA